MHVRHHTEQALGLRRLVPFDADRTVGDDRTERLLELRSSTQTEPQPVLAALGRQLFDGFDQRIRMPRRMRLDPKKVIGDFRRFGHGNDEYPRAGLRKEVTGVENNRTSAHAQPIEGFEHGLEFLAAVDRQKAHDVFKDDDPRQAAIRLEILHEIDKGPECAGSGPLAPIRLADAKTIARRRKILTGERGPSQIGSARQVLRLDLMNVLLKDFPVAPVVSVDLHL